MQANPWDPHFSKSTASACPLTLTWDAAPSSSSSLAMSPAPNSTPKRVTSSFALSTRESSSANCAAAIASWMLRDMTLRFFRSFLST
jgi:hypothetical protein